MVRFRTQSGTTPLARSVGPGGASHNHCLAWNCALVDQAGDLGHASKVTDNESKVGWASQNALEVGEASAGAPFPVADLEVAGHASQHHACNRWRVHNL
jgi:hypothetical protein